MASYEKVPIPLATGISEADADQAFNQDPVEDVINGRFPKKGEIVKRHGFSTVTSTIEGGVTTIGDSSTHGPVRGLFATEKELCAIGGRRLFTYSPELDWWNDRGEISPFTGKIERTFYGQRTHESADMCADPAGSYFMYASQVRHTYVDELNAKQTITKMDVVVRDEEGATILPRTEVDDGGTLTATRPHSVRCTGVTGRLVVARVQGGDSTPTTGTLRVSSWLTSTPTVAPALDFTISDIYHSGIAALNDPWHNARSYDMFTVVGGGSFVIAWIDATSRDINLNLYDNNMSLQLSGSAAVAGAGAQSIAACDDPVNDLIYVVVDNGAGIIAYTFTRSTLVQVSGPTDIATLPWPGASQVTGLTLGITKGTLEDGTERVAYVWSSAGNAFSLLGNVDNMRAWDMEYTSSNLTLGDIKLERKVGGCYPVSKIWNHNGRFYCGFAANNSKHHLFGYSGVLDLHITEQYNVAGIQDARIASLFDVGFSPCLGAYTWGSGTVSTGPQAKGSLNSVVQVGNVVRYMSLSHAGVLAQDAAQPRLAADEVTFDFDGAVTATATTDGAAVIGGGYVSHYSGHEVCELGFPLPPFLIEFDTGIATVPVGEGPDGTEHYAVGVFYWHDGSGLVHRSMPSPSEAITAHTAGSSIEYRSLLYNGSHRPIEKLSPVFFRSSETDINFRRVQRPSEVARDNVDYPQNSARMIEITKTLGDFLYTQGGAQIENVSPEGAAIAAVAIDRLWLGALMRRDRLQFSKPFIPGTAGEHGFAPEFNEAFNRLTPNGREVTGLIEMDDRLIVFTAEDVYWLAGDGPNDAGAGSDYPPLTRITADTGCIDARSVLRTPAGIMFQGKRGLALLTRKDEVRFVGHAVIDQTDAYPVITSATLNATTSEVYFTTTNAAGTSGQILVFNYEVGAWSRWTSEALVGGCMFKNEYYTVTAAGQVYKYDSSTFFDSGSTYVPLTVETGWFRSGGPGGYQRVRRIVPVMQRKDGHALQVDTYQNYSTTAIAPPFAYTGTQVAAFPSAEAYHPKIQNRPQLCESFKLRISDANATETSTGEGYSIAGLVLEYKPRRGTVRVGSGQRK